MDIWKELFGTIGWWVLLLMTIAWVIREWWGLKKHGEEERIPELIKIQIVRETYSLPTSTEPNKEEF